jgi:hypothetical protein
MEKQSDLAKEARRRKVEIRASAHGAESAVENEALQAVYALEEFLFLKHGRNVRATRTWQMIRRHGIIGAVERAVNRRQDRYGFMALIEMGMQDLAFESVVIRYPEIFSERAVEMCRRRLVEFNGNL